MNHVGLLVRGTAKPMPSFVKLISPIELAHGLPSTPPFLSLLSPVLRALSRRYVLLRVSVILRGLVVGRIYIHRLSRRS